MTVRLLIPAYGKQTNALYAGTVASERALVDAGQADNSLDASFDYPAYAAGKSVAEPSNAVDVIARGGLGRGGASLAVLGDSRVDMNSDNTSAVTQYAANGFLVQALI
ncbi:MAG: hypothetical protein EON59_14895, partial [Alphaproteobacteria bacterium]